MATRYAQASTGSPVGVGDEASDNQGERYESPVLLTGTSTPAGIGSWVSLSPNIHTSDSDLEAYQADNDDDLISDSPVEDQEERPRGGVLNLPRNIEVEQEEALRASLSTILASSERPRFRQARERELRARTANRFRTLATNPTNPSPLFFPRDTSPHFNSTSVVTNDTSTSAINPRNLNRQQGEEDGQSKTSNSTSEYESVSSLSLGEISDISKSARKSWKKESGHSVDGSSDDGNKWYSGDITVKVWTAAVISGVLLGAGFGAGSLWRGSRAGHYTATPA